MKIDKSAVIVLDLDDTLYEEIEFLKSGYRQIADRIVSRNFTDPYDEMLAIYYTGGDSFREIIRKYRYPFTVDELLSIYRNHIPRIKLSADAGEFLHKLKETDSTTGLITDGRSIAQRNKIRALGIESYFSDIIISEEFGSAKPSPENYLFFMNKYPHRKYYYIGNNIEKDFMAPNELGWTTLCIGYKDTHIHKPPVSLPQKYLPHYTIDTFADISLV